MAKPTTKLMERFPELYNIQPSDFESIFQYLGSGELPNLNSLSSDIVSVVRWVRMRLGEPKIKIQLTNDQIGVCYEEAYLQFSAEIQTIMAQNNLIDVYGKNKYQNLSDKAIHNSFTFFVDMANYLANQSNVGGTQDIRKGYISTSAEVQSYNLLTESYDLETGKSLQQYFIENKLFNPIQVIKVYYDQPVGYYNKLAVDMNQYGLAVPNLANFGGNTYTQIYPNWDNYLWKQHAKQFSELFRSMYRYELAGSNITLIPAPIYGNMRIYFEYRENKDTMTSTNDPSLDNYYNDGISNFSNIPLHELAPELINSIGKNWIRKYTMALSKELLGTIRNTISSGIKIPTGDEITLNGDQLLSDAKEEQNKLIDDLRVTLEKFDMVELLRKRAEMMESNVQILNQIPLPIFIG